MRTITIWLWMLTTASLSGANLPGRYFELMEAGAERVQDRLDKQDKPTLESIESAAGWRHFPQAILAPAVLYAKKHPDNRRYGDPRMRDLAIRIGDILTAEDEQGTFEPRLDSDWDAYMWLESYRLLGDELGAERQARWAKAIKRNIALVLRDARERIDFPWYNSPYIGTSPNHYSQYANNLLLAGRVFGNEEWVELASKILHRFATVEQTQDGYWGEHSRNGPTTGYNHLTLSAVALYWEMTRDPEALEALRRATDFHMNFTYPDGKPVEVINDRNRHWNVSAWGQFAFSSFPDGRGYAAFLASFFDGDTLTMSDLGRLSQDALYYNDGPVEAPPQHKSEYYHRMSIPASIRKTDSWVVALSGIVDTQAINSRFYLDRQGHMSVFHEKTGVIVSGANSKRQPELATFSETLLDRTTTIPLSSRLQADNARDRLSLAFNTFWADLFVPKPAEDELDFRFVINGKGTPAEEIGLNLQLVLHTGEMLETGAGRSYSLSESAIDLGPAELGGWIRHHGWTLQVDPEASLSWPVRPHNPYSDAPEHDLVHAVGRLSVPLELHREKGRYVRPNEREVSFKIRVE